MRDPVFSAQGGVRWGVGRVPRVRLGWRGRSRAWGGLGQVGHQGGTVYHRRAVRSGACKIGARGMVGLWE